MLALNGALGSNADYQLAYTMHYKRENFNPDDISDLIYQGIAPKVFDSDFQTPRKAISLIDGTITRCAADFILASTESKRTTRRRFSAEG